MSPTHPFFPGEETGDLRRSPEPRMVNVETMRTSDVRGHESFSPEEFGGRRRIRRSVTLRLWSSPVPK